MFCLDPEIASINVADITATSATVSWSTGRTAIVDFTTIYYRVGATNWTSVSHTSQSTTHTVSALQPGTQYQFYVQITSYGKTTRSDTVTITTGKVQLIYTLYVLHTNLHFGSWSFNVADPTVWIFLPSTIGSF